MKYSRFSNIAYIKTYETESDALIDRMIASGETPAYAQGINIDTAIKSLKDLCLFDKRFDGLWVTRGHGLASTKLNWIKDAHNITKAGAGTLTFTDSVGYSTDCGCALDTNYIGTDGINQQASDSSMFCKVSGNLGTGANRCAMGVRGANFVDSSIYNYYTGIPKWALNDTIGNETDANFADNYNCIARLTSTQIKEYIGSTDYLMAKGAANANPTTYSLYLLACNLAGSIYAPCASTTIMEFAGIGAYITKAEFLAIQTIFNIYFAAL